MSRITVFGAGAWGSTLAQVLCDAGNEVLLWGRNAETVAEINDAHTNQRYLAGQVLPSNLRATTDLDEAFAFSRTYVLAIPSTQLRATLNEWKGRFSAECTIVSTLKGIEVSTMLRMTEIIEQVLGKHKVALLTGPNLADELILRQPAGAVAASTSQEVADQVRQLFRTPYYRVYTSVDLLGCELAGAIKNVIALAVGISIGMGYGENTQAMLITRGLNEVARLCAAHGSDPLTAANRAHAGGAMKRASHHDQRS
jgi:glycerol-3-phosphate dehydrogenase (NAD(P)+)